MVRLVKPEILIVFEVKELCDRPVTEPRSAEKLSADDRNVTLLGPVLERFQLNTNEVGVNENPEVGETIN